MKKKFTLSGIILFFLMHFMFAGNISLKTTLGINGATDTLLNDTDVKSRVYGMVPFVLGNNVPAKTVIYSSSNPAVLLISGDTCTIKGAGIAYLSAMVQGDSATLVTKKVTIYKKTLYVSTPNVWKNVGAANPKFVLIYSGFANGDDEKVILSKPVAMCNYNTSKAGSYPITINGGSANNYSFSFDNSSKLTVVGVALDDEGDKITIYPNPASTTVTVSGLTAPRVIITICNSDGEIVKSLQVENGSFNVSDLPKGLYLLKIVDGSETLVEKLIVE